MADSESRLAESRLLVEFLLVASKVVVKLGAELVVRAHGQSRLFVKQRQDTQLAFDEVDTWLVVGEIDESPVDLLADVLFLLELEDMLVELLLQLLVGIVDAELLERVLGEVLEAVNIEDTDEGVDPLQDIFSGQAPIDRLNKPVEQA